MKRTSSIFLSISLLFLSLNTTAYNIKDFKEDITYGVKTSIKNCGKLALIGGKTAFGLATLYAAITVPIASAYNLRDISALSASITGYRLSNNNPEKVSTLKMQFERNDINLLPAVTIGIGIASTVSLVASYATLKSAWNDVQEILK